MTYELRDRNVQRKASKVVWRERKRSFKEKLEQKLDKAFSSFGGRMNKKVNKLERGGGAFWTDEKSDFVKEKAGFGY